MRYYFKPEYYIKYIQRIVRGRYKRTYAQCGEDLLIEAALHYLGITEPTYLDIGANDPILSNNTYLFYTKGYRGVCVEPDPQLFKVLKRKRPKDVCLNVGIGPMDDAHAQYYVLSTKQYSTFIQSEAEQYVSGEVFGAQKIEEILSIPLVSINTLLSEFFQRGLDILSIDTEGYDLEILQAIDFNTHTPSIICVETWRFDSNQVPQKISSITRYLEMQGYSLFADTHVNSVYVHR